MVDYDLIPQSIMKEGKFLKEFGILEYAWTFNSIKEIICILNEKKIPILGGDVYKICNGKIYQTYDSWYINRSNEKFFYSKSYERTISYILDYEKRNEGCFIYSIVFKKD